MRAYNRGDPVVAYDQFAERWVVTQFAFPLEDGRPVGPSYSCVAVSRTSNPALEEDAWCVVDYKYSDTEFYDYPKLGVWQGAYTLTALVPGFEGSVSQLVLIEREPLLDCSGTPEPSAGSMTRGSGQSGYPGRRRADPSGSRPAAALRHVPRRHVVVVAVRRGRAAGRGDDP